MGMEVDHNLVNPETLATLQPKGEHRNALNRDQAFRNGVCEGAQACAMAGCQQERFHRRSSGGMRGRPAAACSDGALGTNTQRDPPRSSPSIKGSFTMACAPWVSKANAIS